MFAQTGKKSLFLLALLCSVAFATPLAAAKSNTAGMTMPGSCSATGAEKCDQGAGETSNRETSNNAMYCAPAVIEAMNTAFRYASLGHSHFEYAFFVKRLPAGTWVTTEVKGSHSFNGVAVEWDPAAVAFGHMHPNHTDGRPSENDMQKADGRMPATPFFVFGSGGLWEYDPAKRRSRENPRRLRQDLQWRRACQVVSSAAVDRASSKAK